MIFGYFGALFRFYIFGAVLRFKIGGFMVFCFRFNDLYLNF